jgi:hypothetical protein
MQAVAPHLETDAAHCGGWKTFASENSVCSIKMGNNCSPTQPKSISISASGAKSRVARSTDAVVKLMFPVYYIDESVSFEG